MRKRELRQFIILVADSHLNTRNIIENALTKRGYRVLSCSSAADVVGFLEENDIDIVIADIKILNDSGLDLVEYVRTNFKVVVIMLVDGCDSFEGPANALKIGVNEYLIKPFTNKELTVSVRRAIEKLVYVRSSYR